MYLIYESTWLGTNALSPYLQVPPIAPLIRQFVKVARFTQVTTAPALFIAFSADFDENIMRITNIAWKRLEAEQAAHLTTLKSAPKLWLM